MATPSRCATHPDVETRLRCGKCGKPICPLCLYQTPTGGRCKDCANLQPPVLYQLSLQHYVKGSAAGLGLGLGVGIAWGLLRFMIPLAGLFDIALAAGAGYFLGEGVSRAANRRRGLPLEVIAGSGTVLAFAVSQVFRYGIILLSLWGLVALIVGVMVAVGRLR